MKINENPLKIPRSLVKHLGPNTYSRDMLTAGARKGFAGAVRREQSSSAPQARKKLTQLTPKSTKN